MTTLKAGDFCWAELGTKQLKGAKDFYKSIFNWEIKEQSFDGGTYAMINANGQEIGGAFEIDPDMEKQGMHSAWNAYILVKNVDEMTKKAKSLGATILKEPFDVMEAGRMAVFKDPTGAVLSFWQPKDNSAKSYDKSKHGSCGWLELMTSDTTKAKKFYTELFGWQAEKQETSTGHEYITFKNNGQPVAGMMQITPDMKGMASFWGLYFTVENFDKALKTAKSKGANMMFEPIDMPEVGRFTMFTDPQGVHFSVIQFSNQMK